MKKISTLIAIMFTLFAATKMEAQKTYTISSNTSWTSASYPSFCSSCTFNISSGKTLTIDKNSVSCASCTFNGGNISITKDFACQSCSFNSDSITMNNTSLNLQSSTISFSAVHFTITGTGSVTANAPVNVSNSVFTFSGSSYFINNSGTLNLTKSVMYFYNSSYFLANAGPVNLKSTSSLVAGNGSTSSTAYIKMNGSQLNVYDNSFIGLGNSNNYYFNWNTYYSASGNKSFSTAINTMNCGSAGENKCSAPFVYGPASLASVGIVPGKALPIVLADFNASVNAEQSVKISWNTQQEINSDYFTIERSADGSNWEAIGTVKAKGNSSIISYYSFVDASPLSSDNYYRLQMTDIDGKNASSEIIHIVSSFNEKNKASVFPNPITNLSLNVRVASAEPIVVNVFAMEGRMLFTLSLRGQLQYHVQLPSNTAHNTYLAIQIVSKTKTESLSVFNK